MRPLFADAFFFFALWSRRDLFHERVLETMGKFRGRLVTTRWVLMKVADGLADSPERKKIKRWFDQFERDETMEVIGFEEDLYRSGLALYDERPDKAWSLTDCISFVVMEREGLHEALTGDRHFAQAGYVALFKE